jgi:hypothetical protein
MPACGCPASVPRVYVCYTVAIQAIATMGSVPETPKFIFRLPVDLRDELEAIARAEDRSLSNLIVYALRQWLALRRRGKLDSPD